MIWAHVTNREVSRASPCPTAHLLSPVLLPITPAAPTTRGSALLKACAAHCSLVNAASKSLLLHGVTAWGCSRHHPRILPWRGRSPSVFNQGKHKVLHLGRDNARLQHRQQAARLERSLAEEALQVLVGTKLTGSQQRALPTRNTNCVLGCVRRSEVRKVSLPLHLALVMPQLERRVRFWVPQ